MHDLDSRLASLESQNDRLARSVHRLRAACGGLALALGAGLLVAADPAPEGALSGESLTLGGKNGA